ncbi:hypothetical protein RQM65_10135 [Pricia sp. S334]|uniref:DUF4332 domain-containing protein n=1 Tax=Pricia mediterranea TaxID=3076079 RepID=A0ABU3L6R6_9FLAO|nr:hypothetical protein [Pricia sp. S334]MDT7829021.1 hypothetical protein [Pricia sp. S334]
MDVENVAVGYWLILLFAGIICGILGYYMGKGIVAPKDISSESSLLRDENSKLRSELETCKQKLLSRPGIDARSSSEGREALMETGLTPTAPTLVAFDAKAASDALGKTIEKDDLTVIEGIGPKIAGMFHHAGIMTWKALSETSVANCQEILNTGAERYKVHDPSSWPMQAKMCHKGMWKELFRWQEEHDHGKL